MWTPSLTGPCGVFFSHLHCWPSLSYSSLGVRRFIFILGGPFGFLSNTLGIRCPPVVSCCWVSYETGLQLTPQQLSWVTTFGSQETLYPRNRFFFCTWADQSLHAPPILLSQPALGVGAWPIMLAVSWLYFRILQVVHPHKPASLGLR